jgi:hypothetical protein
MRFRFSFLVFSILTIHLITGSFLFGQSVQIFDRIQLEREDFKEICSLDHTDIDAHYRFKPINFRAKLPHAETGSNFQVTYVNNCGTSTWPDQAITAFEYAAEIWSSHIQSVAPIHIEATWESLGSGVLGAAGPSNFFQLTGDDIFEETWYPIALASALVGFDIKEDERFDIDYDINVVISCDFNDWYFGTDANTPAGMIDLVTVMLHEIGHGIGFTGSMSGRTADRLATWGFQAQSGGRFPVVYDQFTLDGSFNRIINTSVYPNTSNTLYDAVTGQRGGVYFSGPEAEFAINGQRVPLYAPPTWAQGSSYSHFDQAFFSNTENALMRPAIDRALAIHSPGPAFCGLLDDIGWPLGTSCIELLDDNLVLQRPELISPFNGSEDLDLSPLFAWSPVTGAEGYQFQIATDFDFNSQVANEFTTDTEMILLNELNFSGFYFWRVRALNPEGNSSWSSVWWFSTTTNPPDVASLISPADGTQNLRPGFEIRWSEAERAERYDLQIAKDPDFADLIIDRNVAFTGFASTQSLELFTDYYWRVRGTNKGGAGEWSEAWNFKTIIQRPETVLLGTPSDEQNQVSVNAQFTWQPSDRAADYTIQISTEEDFSMVPFEIILDETSYTAMMPLEFATIYYWRVQAANIGGLSEWSTVNTFTTEVRETRIDPNYPNPFNSSTTLRYQLSDTRDVLIDVFDITGRRVAVLVNEQQNAGVYFSRMNASGLASGIYLVRFVAGEYSNVQKISVVK